MFSCRLQIDDRGKDYLEIYEPARQLLNEVLPKDVKLFSLMPVANKFDAHTSTSHREYSYFLPSFMLLPISELNLEAPKKIVKVDESAA